MALRGMDDVKEVVGEVRLLVGLWFVVVVYGWWLMEGVGGWLVGSLVVW